MGEIDIKDYWQNYIDGEWVDGGAGRIDVSDPATGRVLAAQALADATDVDHAVQAARQVHLSGELSGLRPVDRGRMLRAMGAFLLEQVDEIAPLLTLEQGKALWEARVEVHGAARCFEYFGNQAESVEGRSIPLGDRYLDFTLLEPHGVSAQIVPSNFPLEMAARGLAPALATGNACIVKTPELAPLSCAWLARAAEAAGLPTGAVNVLSGYGREAGAALAGHPDINQVTFTGAMPTGIAIAKAAALNVVPCVLELGGKSAAIVHEDADLDAFVEDVRWGIFFNAGQIRSAMSRVIAHESLHDDLVERIAAMASGLDVGPGISHADYGANMGALVSERQRDRAEEIVTEAISLGANLATGGGRPSGHAGAFLSPTVLTDVTADMPVVQEELFAPVLSVQRFRDDDEAIEQANATRYGLVAGVYTRDLDRATTAARRLRAGQVFVNEWYAGGVETPFGGQGRSGYGQMSGREALKDFVRVKNVAIRMG